MFPRTLIILTADYLTIGSAEADSRRRNRHRRAMYYISTWLPEHPVWFLVAVAEVTEKKRIGMSVAREDGRKRRKYQRDRYKYGAIYDSLMYSWIFMPARDVIARHRMNLRYVASGPRGKLAAESISPWFMPRLSFSGVTTVISVDFSLSFSLSISFPWSCDRNRYREDPL